MLNVITGIGTHDRAVALTAMRRVASAFAGIAAGIFSTAAARETEWHRALPAEMAAPPVPPIIWSLPRK